MYDAPEWGRVGSAGTVRKEWFNTQEEAIVAGNRLCMATCKKGYQAIPAVR
ncbi:MAG: WGR domain-containing protein [Methylococcales bacterium]